MRCLDLKKIEDIQKEAEKKILNIIQASDYPKNHPFLHKDFQNDFIFKMILLIDFIENNYSIFKKSKAGKGFLNQLLEDKMKSVNNGNFDRKKFFENLSELTFLYYIITSLIVSKKIQYLKNIYNEPIPYLNSKHLLEYAFEFDFNGIHQNYNIEIKTIKCDPLYEKSFKNNQLVIKPLFPDTNLEEYFTKEELKNYEILEDLSHCRQINKNLKNINNKFIPCVNGYNIGVIVFQFATSMEEVYSYLYHKEKGILKKNSFGSIDLIVFFSLTATPEPLMEDIYETGHIFSILNNDKMLKEDFIKNLRLDNFIGYKDIFIIDELEKLVNREYIISKFIIRNDLMTFVSPNMNENELDEITRDLNNKIYNK